MSRYHLDAYSAIDRARAELTSFVRSSFRFQSPLLDERVHRLIDEFGLVAPSVVEATFPYEEPAQAPRTTAELAAAGLIHPDLVPILANASGEACWPANRALYKHQVEAVRAYQAGKSVVVASGTGSGKTECFLFPAIDKVLRDGDLDTPGVRVLIVYPLNALVNNQMDRLRALLGHHPKIRFALYTRRLEHTERTAVRKLERSGQVRLPAEIISRERLRESPPHILITNFSMLEYALVRPADEPIFSKHFSSPKLLVLDEAHVYAGAMAAEITMLLRRAWLRWGLDPHTVQGIVTSATMHQGVNGGPELLRKFSGDILSKSASSVVAIEGSRIIPPDSGVEIDVSMPEPSIIAALCTDFPTLRAERKDDGSLFHVFDTSRESLAAARAVVECLRPGFAGADANLPGGPLLHEALEPLAWVRSLRKKLHGDRLRVDLVANDLFGPGTGEATRRQAVHKLLEVLSLARSSPEGLPLLPVRLHAIVRGPHGVYASSAAAVVQLSASCASVRAAVNPFSLASRCLTKRQVSLVSSMSDRESRSCSFPATSGTTEPRSRPRSTSTCCLTVASSPNRASPSPRSREVRLLGPPASSSPSPVPAAICRARWPRSFARSRPARTPLCR
jgi:hypothetical protein